MSLPLLFSLLALSGETLCFKPPGDYDLSLGEIEPLCDMMDEMESSGQAAEPKPFSSEAEKDGCMYFSWQQCDESQGDSSRPCGWYEMKSCGDSNTDDTVDGGDEESNETKRKKRSLLAPKLRRHHGRSRRPSARVILGLPDEIHDIKPHYGRARRFELH